MAGEASGNARRYLSAARRVLAQARDRSGSRTVGGRQDWLCPMGSYLASSEVRVLGSACVRLSRSPPARHAFANDEGTRGVWEGDAPLPLMEVHAARWTALGRDRTLERVAAQAEAPSRHALRATSTLTYPVHLHRRLYRRGRVIKSAKQEEAQEAQGRRGIAEAEEGR